MIVDSKLEEKANTLREQECAVERTLELSLIEAATALLCWCERVEEHPDYAASVRVKPTLVATVRQATSFALHRRAELMTHRSSAARMKEELKRLKSMVGFLKHELWPTLEQPPSENPQGPPTLRLN